MPEQTDRTRETNIVKSHLGRMAPEDVLSMAGRVRLLQESEGWQIVTGLLAQMREDTLTQLEQNIASHEVYTYHHGRLRGMKAVESIVVGVLEASDVADRQLREIAAQTARENA